MLMQKIESVYWKKQLQLAKESFGKGMIQESEHFLEKAYGEAVWHLRYFVKNGTALDRLEEVAQMVDIVITEAEQVSPEFAQKMSLSYEIEVQWVFLFTGIDMDAFADAEVEINKHQKQGALNMLSMTMKSWFGQDERKARKKLLDLVIASPAYHH